MMRMALLLLGALAGCEEFKATELDQPGEAITGCRVTDDDTIRCGDERVRLIGINAPELPGHCRQGRTCAPGDPEASKASLSDALSGALTIKRSGEDSHGRTLGLVAANGHDLSCHQLESGHAIYCRDWDKGLAVQAQCPEAAARRLAPIR